MRLVMLGVMVSALAGTASAASSFGSVRFEARPGWHVGVTSLHSCAGKSGSRCVQTASWAATVRWRDCWVCLPPRATLERLPRNGVAIYLGVSRDSGNDWHRPLTWPPRFRSTDVVGSVEGGPERIGLYQQFGRLRDMNASLWVLFGRRHPSEHQVARAEAELRSAELP